ncbi:MAG: hypothetical protein ACOY3I_06600 [Verrucomicrobiota bacterium]
MKPNEQQIQEGAIGYNIIMAVTSAPDVKKARDLISIFREEHSENVHIQSLLKRFETNIGTLLPRNKKMEARENELVYLVSKILSNKDESMRKEILSGYQDTAKKENLETLEKWIANVPSSDAKSREELTVDWMLMRWNVSDLPISKNIKKYMSHEPHTYKPFLFAPPIVHTSSQSTFRRQGL